MRIEGNHDKIHFQVRKQDQMKQSVSWSCKRSEFGYLSDACRCCLKLSMDHVLCNMRSPPTLRLSRPFYQPNLLSTFQPFCTCLSMFPFPAPNLHRSRDRPRTPPACIQTHALLRKSPAPRTPRGPSTPPSHLAPPRNTTRLARRRRRRRRRRRQASAARGAAASTPPTPRWTASSTPGWPVRCAHARAPRAGE